MTKQEKSTLKELTLLTLYLGGWEEDSKEPGKKIFRAWKEPWKEMLNKLERAGQILTYQKGPDVYLRSVVITDKGRKKAEKLKQGYLTRERKPEPTEGKHVLVYRNDELVGAGTLKESNGIWYIIYERDGLPYDGKVTYKHGELVFNAPGLVFEGEQL